MAEDIIAAQATAWGEGGIAIVRLSGEGCARLAGEIFRGRRPFEEQPPRYMALGSLCGHAALFAWLFKAASTMDSMIGYDDEIIRLRRSVKQASVAKMERGTISGTDLATDINAEHAAVQDKILHETQRLEAIYNLKFATNN